MRKKRLSTCLPVLVAVALTGCSHQYYRASRDAISHTQKRLDQISTQSQVAAPAVIIKSGFYVDTRPVALQHGPGWVKKPVSLRAAGVPFEQFMSELIGQSAVTVNYGHGVRLTQPVFMNYTGSLKGALDTLSSTLNYAYHFVGQHELMWTQFQDKTFAISFMPGVSQYRVGQAASSGRQAATSSSSQTGAGLIQNDSQYSNLSGRLSVWDDLRRALSRIKTPEGHVDVSESTTTVMVHDRPRAVRAMGRYIAKLNHELAKEVLIKVQLIEVQLYHDYNFGVDWNVLSHTLGSHLSLSGNMASASNIVRNNLILSSTNGSQATFGIGSPTSTFIKALGNQGRVRIVTEPQVTTMNNQMGSIRINKNTAYIESVSQTQGQTFSSTAVNPGHVIDGFSMYILPKIQGDKVFLQISSTVSHLDRLDKLSTQPDNAQSTSANNPGYQAIQLPTLSQKSFNQRSFIRSGSTLIMAGFKRMEDQTKEASLFGLKPLGGEGAVRNNVETLLLITPVIIESPESHVDAN